jgi:uncharacterized protein DUF4340
VVETAVSAPRSKRRVLVVWVVLLALIGAIAVIEVQDRARSRSADANDARDPRMLLPVAVADLGAVEIAHAGVMHRFERDATGTWFYHGVHTPVQGAHGHQTDPVLAKRIDAALTALGRAHIEREFGLEKGVAEYGLNTPQMVILLYRSNQQQPLAQYAIGDVAPDTYSRYMMVVGRSKVGTIPNYQIENLLGLIKEAAASAPSKKTS